MGYTAQVHVVYGFFVTFADFRKSAKFAETSLRERFGKEKIDEEWEKEMEDLHYDLVSEAHRIWKETLPNVFVSYLNHDIADEFEKTDGRQVFFGVNCLETETIWSGYAGGKWRETVSPHLTVGEFPLLTARELIKQLESFEEIGKKRFDELTLTLQGD